MPSEGCAKSEGPRNQQSSNSHCWANPADFCRPEKNHGNWPRRNKIANIRNGFSMSLNYAPIYTVPDLVLCECDCRFDSFYPVSLDELSLIFRKLISKSCELDPLPAGLLQDTSVTLLPVICKIVNASLKSGSVPSCLKTGS
ncbi:hypothetical protein AC249_AIPGENE18076 [Exaiptasia diaphana]|nr:hypothetical protein AC249_AIPGENE18076 [Exaiptasia diaphana]